ncbi:MAG: energy-coupling factor transporter transmembrane component T [Chloroflexota bacterium]|jgi:energy-coupling factor transport system permease protein|nr:energy-coupling factor transporter transmembrane component T [Chloroflexota bacterium]
MRKLSFRPGQTVFHKLYPTTKFFWLLIGSVIALILTDSKLLVLFACMCLLILLSIQPKIWQIRGFRFAILTGVVLFCLYLLFDKTDRIILNPSVEFLTISSGGLEMGSRVVGRFLAIIFLSYIFILTTEPSDLAYGLMKLGLPYRFGFMLVTALRLAPILEEEGQTIYKAQLVRGIRYDTGGIKKWILIVQQFMTPLLISALRRADKLVFSMEGRGFGKYTTRTFRNQSSPTSLDLIMSIILTLLFTTLILLNYGVLK